MIVIQKKGYNFYVNLLDYLIYGMHPLRYTKIGHQDLR